MTTISVWLLVIVTHVNSGSTAHVGDHFYATSEDCMQVLKNMPKESYVARCIQTNVMVKK